MSDTFTCKSFKLARVRVIHTVSQETMLANVVVTGASVMCPPTTSRNFWRRSSIFYVKYHVTFHMMETNGDFVPVGKNLERNSQILHFLGDWVRPKGVAVLLIKSVSFHDRSWHLNPKFMRFFRKQVLHFYTNAIRCSHLHSTAWTHQLKARLSSIPCATTYLATTLGYVSFKFLRDWQEVDPSFHWTHKCHPTVNRRSELQPLWTIRWLSFLTAFRLLL